MFKVENVRKQQLLGERKILFAREASSSVIGYKLLKISTIYLQFFSESESTADQSSTLRFELNFIQLGVLVFTVTFMLNKWQY